MVESSVDMNSNGLDPQSKLFDNIKSLSSMMGEAENAGHSEFSSKLSDVRSDLMLIAGISSEYDSRNPEAVRNDFHAHGAERIQQLMQEASRVSSPNAPEFASVTQASLGALVADLQSSHVMQQPELQTQLGQPAQSMAAAKLGALANVVPGLAGFAKQDSEASVSVTTASQKPVVGPRTAELQARANAPQRPGQSRG